MLGETEAGMLCVDLSKPPAEDIPDDRPVSVRDALVFMELAVLDAGQSLFKGEICLPSLP